jgi:hypothetical protein
MPNYGLGPSPANGQYFAGAASGSLFSGGNQAAVTTALTAGLTTTYTGGLILANPPTNTGIILILLRVQVAFIVAQTNAAAIGLGVGSGVAITSPGTAIASQSALAGGTATATGVLYSPTSATLPAAPYLTRLIGSVDTGALTTEVNGSSLALDLQGSIILPPGSYACITSTATGTASSFLGSFTWVEAQSSL